MKKEDHFSSAWLSSREPYDNLARTKYICEFIKDHNRIVDIGAGTGSFLRWCLLNNINFSEILMIDNDLKLLDKFFSLTSTFCKKHDIEFSKISNKHYSLKKSKESKHSKVILLRKDIDSQIDLINDFDLISFSALSDLLSSGFLSRTFKHIKKDKILYFSICFNGKISWNKPHSFDKYILTAFNRDQQKKKGTQISLGFKSVDKIQTLSKKYNYKCKKLNSSWILESTTEKQRKFHISYLKTIYQPLKKDPSIDNEILNKWIEKKLSQINNSSLITNVGHNDLIIRT